MDNESNFALQESFRFEVKEFSASDIPCPPNDDAPVVFSGLKWDMWNRVHLCTNKPYVYQITSRDTPSVEHTLDCGAVPLTVLHTQKNLIVSTEEGMLTWYRVEQPYENQDGTVDNTMCMNITDAVDQEYEYFEQRAKVDAVGSSDDSVQQAPIAYLKYSRSYSTIIYGTQTGELGRIAIQAEKQEEEEEENQAERQKKVLDNPIEFLGQFHTAPIGGIRELPDSTQFVTISDDNNICVWEATNQKLLSMTPIFDRPVSVSVDSQGFAAFVGTENGAFLVYDVSNRSKPRLVKQMRFFEDYQPLDLLVPSLDGKLLICSSTQSDKIFVCSQKCVNNYTVFGFL